MFRRRRAPMMLKMVMLPAVVVLASSIALIQSEPLARAHGGHSHTPLVKPPRRGENIRALPKDLSGKRIVRGMKGWAKGLGVECEACHVKGDFAADAKPAKLEARKFIASMLREKDSAKFETALRPLLKALGRDAPADAAQALEAFGAWRED